MYYSNMFYDNSTVPRTEGTWVRLRLSGEVKLLVLVEEIFTLIGIPRGYFDPIVKNLLI